MLCFLPASWPSSLIPRHPNTSCALLIPLLRRAISTGPFSPFRSALMKSQTGRPGGMCSISPAKTEGGLRSNWQHRCFQCNCTYLASHLRGSFRGSGLIEQSIVKWRGAQSRAAPTVGPLGRSQKLSQSLAHPFTRDTFNQSTLIAPPL